jgi:Protein of unknown function (DUF3987)
VSRGREAADHPALSAALAVQPDVIQGLAAEATLRTRGFLARFLYAIPPSLVGRRRVAPPPVPPVVAEAFHENMMALWRMGCATGEDGKPVPHWLHFSAGADAAMRAFEAWLEPRLAEGEEIGHLAGWANKLAGAVARIAGILHLAAAAGGAAPGAVSREAAESAIRIGRDYLLPHALAAFGLMGADPRVEEAKRVLTWLAHSVNSVNCVNGGRFSARAPKGGFRTLDSASSPPPGAPARRPAEGIHA